MSTNIVIVGAGFCGTLTAKKLADRFYGEKDISIQLIDRHSFQTMRNQLFEVVAGRVKENSVKINLNQVFKGTKVKLVKDEISSIDFGNRCVKGRKSDYEYDYLVIASGSKPTYFGIEGAEEYSQPLWSYEDAVALREHIKLQFCKAKLEEDRKVREALLTFFIVGAGFTGVETAAELAEWVPSLCSAYSINRCDVKIIECDMLDRPVQDFPRKLSKKISNRLEDMGVELKMNTGVVSLSENKITIKEDSREKTIPTATVIWAAGVEGSDLIKNCAESCEINGRYRIAVNENLMADKLQDVYVGGDNAFIMLEDAPNPQVVENAKQTAAVIANNIEVDIRGKGEYIEYNPSFHGFMVSLGGRYGVANVGFNDTRFPLPAFMSQAAKHVSNIIYTTSVAGIFRTLEYIEDEFLEVPDRRSFISLRFKQPWEE